MTRFLTHAGALALGLILTMSTAAHAAEVLDGFDDELIAENLRTPTAFAFLPDGSALIMERDGRLLHADLNSLPASPTEVLQVPDVDLFGERGATAITVDPAFDTNGYIYVWYASASDLTMRLSRFTMVGLTADPLSEFIVWESPDTHGTSEFHFGGGIEFGPDGNIWFSMGDRSVPPNAQDLTVSSGKIHRVTPTGGIPEGNPFADGAGPNIDSIFSYGQRNPWRIRWHGDNLYVAEVGQDANEDLNVVRLDEPGSNFGWPLCEGTCSDPAYTDPVWTYVHDIDTSSQFPNATTPNTRFGASITGGDVYAGSAYPAEYQGAYFFADYANRWIGYLDFTPAGPVDYHEFARFTGPLVDVRVGPDGAVYYLSLLTDGSGNFASSGYLRRVAFAGANQAPLIGSATATPTSGQEPLEVTFMATATDPEGDPITYSWVTGDGSTVSGATATHTYLTPGPYNARVEVSDGTNTTSSSSILIQVGSPPVGNIQSPIDGSLFRAGDVLSMVGGSDDPADLLEWEVILGHDDHLHPRFTGTGTTAAYTVPNTDHSFTDETWFDIILTATDSAGLTASTSVRVDPDKVNISFNTSPGGIPLLLDGVLFDTPDTVDTLIGFNHTLGAPSTHVMDGRIWEFDGWSNGQSDSSFTYIVPEVGESVTASYVNAGPSQSYDWFLSDLPFVSATNAWGPVERDLENGDDLGRDGFPIRLGGIEYSKGLGVNANSSVVVDVPASCSSFEALVGIDDIVTPEGSATFHVLVDDVEVASTAILTSGSSPVPISVDVSGAGTLELMVDRTADGGDFDHADWAEARFECSTPGPGPDVDAPSFPVQSMQALSVTSVSMELAWAEAIDDLGVAGYRVYADGQVVATTFGAGTTVLDLDPLTTYAVQVQAFDGAGNETEFGPTLDVTTNGVDTPEPDPPIVNDDSAIGSRGQPLLIDVLANDVDPDGDPLMNLVIVDPPLHGTAVVVDEQIEYTHGGSDEISDSLTYRVSDGTFTSALATVTISIVNAPPVAESDTASAGVFQTIEVAILSNDVDTDGDPLVIEIVDQPQFGTVEIVGELAVYTNTERADLDSFTYRLFDGQDYSETAIVEISMEGGVGEGPPDDLGLVNPASALWHLDGVLQPFYYGTPGDSPLVGDWDCDGIDTVGMYRDSDGFVYLRNSNSTGVADIQFLLGLAGDIPLAGDFDGDGCDTISIYRPSLGQVFIANELGEDNGVIVADYSFFFGDPGDKPFAGDFDADGADGIGLHRESTGFVYVTYGSDEAVAPTDNEFFFGDPGDRLVAGNWIEQGFDTVGLFRPEDATFYLRFSNDLGIADASRPFGESDWLPVAGHFA